MSESLQDEPSKPLSTHAGKGSIRVSFCGQSHDRWFVS